MARRVPIERLERVFLASYSLSVPGPDRLRESIRAVLVEAGVEPGEFSAVDLERVRRLKDQREKAASARPLIIAVSKFYGVPVKRVLCPTRGTVEEGRVRAFAMWVVRLFTRLTLVEIGALFDRDHSSVVVALQKVEGMFADDTLLRARLQRIGRSVKVRAPGSALVAA